MKCKHLMTKLLVWDRPELGYQCMDCGEILGESIDRKVPVAIRTGFAAPKCPQCKAEGHADGYSTLWGECSAGHRFTGNEFIAFFQASPQVYEERDSILPILELENPCGVRVELKPDTVSLFVGQRDWCWDRKTGLLKGAGTAIHPPIAEKGEDEAGL